MSFSDIWWLILQLINKEFNEYCKNDEGKDNPLFYLALKKLLDDKPLNSSEQEELGGLLNKEFITKNFGLSKGMITSEKQLKEISLLVKSQLLICLIEKFDTLVRFKELQSEFNLAWFQNHYEQITNETKKPLPFAFNLRRSMQQSRLYYLFLISISLVLPLYYTYSDPKNREPENIDTTAMYAIISFVLSMITLAGTAEGIKYTNAFFKEKPKFINLDKISPKLAELDQLILKQIKSTSENELESNTVNHEKLKLA